MTLLAFSGDSLVMDPFPIVRMDLAFPYGPSRQGTYNQMKDIIWW